MQVLASPYAGSSAKPVTTGKSGKFQEIYTQSFATTASGDVRGLYWKHWWKSTGGGEIQRLYSVVDGTGVATGATANALHATIDTTATGTVSGAANAIRATVGCAAAATPGGTMGGIQLDSNIGANATVSNMALIRATKSGSVDVPFFLAMDDDQVAKGSSCTSTDGIKIRWHDGTTKYLMVGTA